MPLSLRETTSMDRRTWITQLSLAGGMTLPFLTAQQSSLAQRPASPPPAPKGTGPLRITDIKTILTAPANIRLVVVKVMTSEPGLYGLGCATFTQRARVVETAVDKYLKPFLVGKDPKRIDEVFQSSFVSSYRRNRPVLVNV